MAKLRFGKYKGQELGAVPTDYLQWLVGKRIAELMDDFKTPAHVAAAKELSSRPIGHVGDEHYYPIGGEPDWRDEDEWFLF